MLKTIKKFTASFSAAALIATAVVPVAAVSAEEPYEFSNSFTDVNWRYEEAVSFLYEVEITKGKSPTEFGTYENLTRGDAAIILARALGLDTESAPASGFTDLNQRETGAVNALVEKGIVSGVSKEKFEPKQPLTRGAMAKILVLGYELTDHAVETPFADASGVFKPYIEALYGSEIAKGKTETSYGTHQEITRGDFANLLYRTILFQFEGSWFYADSAQIIDSKTLSASFEEAIPEEYTAQDIADSLIIWAELSNGTTVDLYPKNAVFSADRKTVTFTHEDLAGNNGTLFVDNVVLEFNFIQ